MQTSLPVAIAAGILSIGICAAQYSPWARKFARGLMVANGRPDRDDAATHRYRERQTGYRNLSKRLVAACRLNGLPVR
jgi:hypothetical protein